MAGVEVDSGKDSGESTSMATCVADGPVVVAAVLSSVTSMATCVADGIVVVTAAVLVGLGGFWVVLSGAAAC